MSQHLHLLAFLCFGGLFLTIKVDFTLVPGSLFLLDLVKVTPPLNYLCLCCLKIVWTNQICNLLRNSFLIHVSRPSSFSDLGGCVWASPIIACQTPFYVWEASICSQCSTLTGSWKFLDLANWNSFLDFQHNWINNLRGWFVYDSHCMHHFNPWVSENLE